MIWANNGGIDDRVTFSKNNVIINVSSKGIDDRALYDVYVSLKSSPDERLLITISKKLTMQDLYNLVIEAMESKYTYLKGLKGLRVAEMVSPELNGYSSEVLFKGGKDIKSTSSVATPVPMEYWCDLADNPDNLARTQLTPNCHVLVALESQDLWMTVCLRLHSPDFINFEASMDLKMDLKMHGHDIKVVM